jgi:hypothetical protein
MKTSFAAFVISFAAVFSAYGTTHLGGAIGDQTLDSTGNPYIIDKDVVVPAGKQLTILPGCVLLFNPYTGISVFGGLKVDGAQDHQVAFTSINDTEFNKTAHGTPAPFDWNGISIDEQAGDILIKCARLSYSVYGIKSQYPGVIIEQSVFRQNGQFNFTTNGAIQPVPQNLPYSYSLSKPQRPTNPKPIPDGAKNPVTPEKPQDHLMSTHTLIRYSSLSVGVIGIVTGVVFLVKASDYAKQRDQAGTTANPAEEYARLDDLSKKKELLGDVFLGLGAAGVIGFGLTFEF